MYGRVWRCFQKFIFLLLKQKACGIIKVMKILHCADIHLESKLGALSHNLALMRRDEILQSFCNLAKQAQQNGFGAFVVAGDLFEGSDVSPSTKRALIDAFCSAPDVRFFILTGNHDQSAFGEDFARRLPKNVTLFGEGINSCVVEDVCFVGVDLTTVSQQQILDFDWQREYYNVLICHGDVGKRSEYGAIDLDAFFDKPIDYFALGHIHSYSKEPAGRGFAVYSGCLEPRGYDETGLKGFVRIDTGVLNRQESISFVPYSKRIAYELKLDVSDCNGKTQIVDKAKQVLSALEISPLDMVEFYLVGSVAEDCVFSELTVKQELQPLLFDVKVKNKTKVKVDLDSLMATPSLKAEFLKLANEIENEELRDVVIRYGLNALNGEEVDGL